MSSLPQSVLTGAMAPTVLPMDAAGSADMYYKPSYSTAPIMGYAGFQSTYSVTLSSPEHQLAAFTRSLFDSSAHAQDALIQGFGDQQVPASAETVDLGYGITAKEFPNALLGTTEIVWQEGRWTVRVSGSSSAPVAEASQVAAFLHRYFMPVPTTSGGISVDAASAGTQATVTWTSGDDLLVVRAYPGATSPAQTAMRMAISMESYK